MLDKQIKWGLMFAGVGALIWLMAWISPVAAIFFITLGILFAMGHALAD